MIGGSIPEGADDANDAFNTRSDEANVLQANGVGEGSTSRQTSVLTDTIDRHRTSSG